MEKEKGKKFKIVTCSFTNCKFSGRSNVKRHEAIHGARKPHKCKCGTQTSTKGALKRRQIFSCRLKDVSELEAPDTTPNAAEVNEELKKEEELSPQQPLTVQTIDFNDFVSLEYVMKTKDGTTVRIPGVVEDIPKILYPAEGNLVTYFVNHPIKASK